MILFIIIFGSLILLAGLLLVVNPNIVFGFLQNNDDNLAIQVIAVSVRLIIGILLIKQSNVSRYPLAIEVIGWIFVIAGIFLAVIGRGRFRQLMSWVLTKFKAYGRIAGGIAMAFGGFLIYAFL